MKTLMYGAFILVILASVAIGQEKRDVDATQRHQKDYATSVHGRFAQDRSRG